MPIHPDEHAAHIAVLLAHDEPVQILYTTSNSIGVEQARTRWRVAICGQPGFSGETELATARTGRGDAGIWVRELDSARPGMPEVGQRKFYKYRNIHGVKLLQPSDFLWLSTGVCGHGSVLQRCTSLIGYMLPRLADGADLQFAAQDAQATGSLVVRTSSRRRPPSLFATGRPQQPERPRPQCRRRQRLLPWPGRGSLRVSSRNGLQMIRRRRRPSAAGRRCGQEEG